MKNNKFTLERNENGKSLHITRYFAASVSRVWDAWTKSDILDMWWAPKPWKTETKTMDLRAGGLWLYSMCGPDGEKHWSRADIITVEPVTCLIIDQAFCDENGNINNSLPKMRWAITFAQEGENTKVSVVITCDKPEDLRTMVEMGLEQGFEMALGNLDRML